MKKAATDKPQARIILDESRLLGVRTLGTAIGGKPANPQIILDESKLLGVRTLAVKGDVKPT